MKTVGELVSILNTLEKSARWMLRRRGFESRWVLAQGARVHVSEAKGSGTRAPIAVLHGVGSNLTPYSRMLIGLKRGFRKVAAIETPGHGESTLDAQRTLTPDLAFGAVSEALLTISEEPIVVFGNSLGGGMALRHAIDHPERVAALILSSPAGAPFDSRALPSFLRRFELKDSAEALEFLSLMYHDVPWYARALAGGLVEKLGTPQLKQFFESIRSEHFVKPEELQRLTMPILLLWGEDERLLPPEHIAFFESHLPSHALIERPRHFAHSPYLEFPKVLTERIFRFFPEPAGR